MVLGGVVRGETGTCNPVTSVAACVGDKVGTDINPPFCGGGLVCEFSGPAQECGCAVPAAECPPVDVNDCCGGNGDGVFTDDEGSLITVTGGQVSGAGATLFVDFFLSPTSTNDWIDVDGDGVSGFCDPTANPTGCPPGSFQFVDQLARGYTDGAPLNTHWMFQYRSVGSVNGFNEFVGSQLCGTFVRSIPSEAGQFNQVTYASGGSSLNGTGDYGTGSPVQPCEINFSFLDVPSAWGVQVDAGAKGCFIKCLTNADCPSGSTCVGAICDPLPACQDDGDCIFDTIVGKCRGNPKWDAQPTQSGYGLNPIPSSTGFISNLQTLSRTCGSCSLGGNVCDIDSNCNGTQRCANGACTISNLPCAGDGDCPLVTGQTCVAGAGGQVSLNTDILNPTNDTIFDFIAAVVPVAYIANRGTGVQDVKYSEMQYLFATGRMPNGENLVGATRSAGSGTRNAIMNSTGIDTTWGRGDNVGPEYTVTGQSNLGPGHQSTNGGGSTQVENAVEQRRLAIGTTGLGGPSRAISDAQGFRYEILNLCKDVDTNGNPLCDCSVPNACAELRTCSTTTNQACVNSGDCPMGETCVLRNADRANNGYVRPSTSTILDNCDACCGYTIVGNGSFVVRGNPDQTDPGAPDYMNDGAVRDYINNLADSVASFSGINPNICLFSEVCSATTTQNCVADSDCPVGETCSVPRPCTNSSQCTPKRCDNADIACTVDADCPVGGVCRTDSCGNQLNMPGQFLATTFTLPNGVDCTQSFDDGMEFFATPGLNQTLQNFTRVPPAPLTAPYPTPAFGSINPNSGGRVPARKTGFRYSDGQSGANIQYVYWNGATYTTNLASGQRLAKRNRLQGDFNEDCARDVNDAAELVKALYAPRAWQQTAAAINTGGGCYGPPAAENQSAGSAVDGAIPEVIGDFDGDGSLTKEDLRYFMDGLALSGGVLNRKAGAIAIDNAIAANAEPHPWADNGERLLCSTADVICTVDGNCPVGETCTRLLPAGDVRRNLVIPSAPGGDPTFLAPQRDVDDAGDPFLATGKAYVAGDFRGDVAGSRTQDCRNGLCSITGFPCSVNTDCGPMNPNAGGDPIGWDGRVDDKDLDYVCAQTRVGTWSEINNAVFLDLSADMNGDGDVDKSDLDELIQVILGSDYGDVNLDGVVDAADRAIVEANIANPPANPGWADGDFNCDGVIDTDDFCSFALRGDIHPPLLGDADVDVDDLLCILDGFGDLSLCPTSDVTPCSPDPCSIDDDCVASTTGTVCIDGGCRCAVDSDCDALGVSCNETRQGGRCELVDVDDLLLELDAFSGVAPACSCP